MPPLSAWDDEGYDHLAAYFAVYLAGGDATVARVGPLALMLGGVGVEVAALVARVLAEAPKQRTPFQDGS